MFGSLRSSFELFVLTCCQPERSTLQRLYKVPLRRFRVKHHYN